MAPTPYASATRFTSQPQPPSVKGPAGRQPRVRANSAPSTIIWNAI